MVVGSNQLNLFQGVAPRGFYALVVSILALTGFEFFFRAGYLIVPVFLYAGLIFILKKRSINGNVSAIICFFSFLSLLQNLWGHNQSIFTFVMFFLALTTCYFIGEICNSQFAYMYIQLVTVLALVSLPFFFLTYDENVRQIIIEKIGRYFEPLGYTPDDRFSEFSSNILVYNFKDYTFMYNRNSGPFWEPGMFVVFLNIALYFNIFLFRRIFSFRNIVLIVTIITTFSTTGYIGMFVTLGCYLLFFSSSSLKFVYFLCMAIIFGYVYNLDFMQDKILTQLDAAESSGTNRFGAMLVHLKIIGDNPFLGVGDGLSRYVANYTSATSTANGLTLVFAKFGLFGGVLYYMLLFQACVRIMGFYFERKGSYLGVSLFFLLLVLTFSQDISTRLFYFFLILWGFVLPKFNYSQWTTFGDRQSLQPQVK